ncbi:MAG: hypothetical protein KDM63_17320 [Verrucomicrobiae bacterium]|nr:hypothetical protein [Verrucomicrobiae bacterium]
MRRARLASILVLTLVSLSLPNLRAVEAEPPPPRKVLFFDLWKLDDWHQVELKLGEPHWEPRGTWIDPTDPVRGVHFPTVWRDEASGKWRMVHSLKWSPFTLMAAESDDGIAWHPLSVPDAIPEGGKLAPHHVFTLPAGAGSTAYLDPQATDGYRFRIFARQDAAPTLARALGDPTHPWHDAAKAGQTDQRYITEAVTLVSKDGLHWELKTGGNWRWDQPGWHPEPPVFAFWNASRNTHVMTARPGWGDRRQCLRVSSDLHTWGEPELQFQPDPLDTGGPLGMYGLPVHPVGNGAGYIGLLWMFHNGSSEPVGSFNQFFGTMDAQLTYSYDGVRFFRGPRQPFLPLNPIPEPGCTQIRPCSIVETESEIRIYSEAHRGEHGRERSEQNLAGDTPLGSLLLHTLRPDGWMYLRPTGDWGRILTKPLVLWRPEIRINAAANYGEVRVQLTDEKSQPLPGFSFDDCVPLRGADALDHPVAWKDADLTTVLRQPLRIEVRFRNANLYSLALSHHFLDANDFWRLKNGLAIDPTLFDY